MRFNVGDRVRIKSLDWHKVQCMDDNYEVIDFMNRDWCGYEMTIIEADENFYHMKEDCGSNYWTDAMIEGLVEEKIGTALNPIELKSNANYLTMERVDELDIKIDKDLPSGNQNVWELPDGYQFVDENGNVINATKIVLEKKKGLTQERINAIVHESCILFCKHCGCGVPRDTCISLGTCNAHDEYRSAIRAYLMNKYKD